MAPTGLSLLPQVRATGGSNFAPTDGPEGLMKQGDGASAQASLGRPWDPDTSQILTTLSPGSDVQWGFATDVPEPIEPASESPGEDVTER
jgi:hypothetical protein